MRLPLIFCKKVLSVHSAQTNLIVLTLVLTSVSQLLSCGENRIANSAATRWLGSYSGTGELELWHQTNGSDEPRKTTHSNRNVTIAIQEGTGIGAFLSGIKLIVTYEHPDNTSTSITFPSQRSGPSTVPNLSNHLRLSEDTLNATTHGESLTYNLTLFKQKEGFSGRVESTEIHTNKDRVPPVVWSLNFTITTKE